MDRHTVEKISERYSFEFPANTAVVSTPPPGSWLAPWTSQIDLMVSADAVEVRNDLQGGPHPKAIENKKTEYVLSEILVPVKSLTVEFFDRENFARSLYSICSDGGFPRVFNFA